MAKNKGTFNAGWWNCFYSFAAELLDNNPNADGICRSVLQGAGITSREALWQLDHDKCNNPKVVAVIREYWLSLPPEN